MLYERLSLPWKLLQYPEMRKSIRIAIDCLYYDIKNLWIIQKGNIQNYEELPQEERIKAYAEGELEPHLG